MNSPLAGATLRQRFRVDQRLRTLTALGWPTLLGLSLALTGLVLMALSYRLEIKRHNLQQVALQTERFNALPNSSRTRPIPAVLPSPSTYTADLAQIHDLAKSRNIVLSSGDYRDADPAVIPVDVRVVDLRLNESYANLKEFLAAVLNSLPHAAVQELQVQRKDSLSTRHQIQLKITLIYTLTPKGAAQKAALTAQESSMP